VSRFSQSTASRVVIMAEMHARDLIRRHAAVGLLLALPVAFYLSSAGAGRSAIGSAGLSLAFSIGGATVFSALSASEVDRRLVLIGYRPVDLVLARLAFLGGLGVCIATVFSALLLVSHPATWSVVLGGMVLVAVVSVPLGLLIAALVPRELEATLVLIGVVGIQMAARSDTWISRLLPLHGARLVLMAGAHGRGAVLGPALTAVVYAVAMLLLAGAFIAPRMRVRRAASAAPSPDDEKRVTHRD
jgi:hypothetical protein